ncbi:hypothetical protein I656_00343 [Geobacillus sp. WSUCF1]|nr:hypothetical protein I656_00343 [Geobacillus sp. WSUCF1]
MPKEGDFLFFPSIMEKDGEKSQLFLCQKKRRIIDVCWRRKRRMRCIPAGSLTKKKCLKIRCTDTYMFATK